MNVATRFLAGFRGILGVLLVGISAAQAATVAHWDFNTTNALNGAFMAGNGERADLDGDGAMNVADFRNSVSDLTGNGNHLTAWTSSWMKWSADSVMGDFSIEHGNSWPASNTDSSFNPLLTGTDVETITPAQWTVEALFKSANLGGFCTIMGRDGRNVGGNGSSAAALYFSTRGTDLAIEFTDVQGGKHNLQVPANLKAGVWYSAAAVSDGATLSLYLNREVIGTLDLTSSGTDTALGLGYGTWTLARGMWADGHVDRFYGKIDAAAISDTALVPSSFVIPVPAACIDTDHDGMSDLYEYFFHLNATNSLDAPENYDADTLINFAEFLLSTDPRSADTDTDGLNDDEDLSPLSRAVMMWGHPDFTTGDTYAYTGPDWWLGSGKIGGVWTNGASWMVPANEQGLLYIDIDRTLMTNNLVLNLMHQNVAECQVYLDLGDTNGTYVATNLYGNLLSGDGTQVMDRYILPLAAYPTAATIVIDATAGAEPYTVWVTTLYEDADTDGLDAQQEIQFGTLDTNPDTDADELIDYIEAMVLGTDALDSDSDKDGFPDGMEVLEMGTSPLVPMQQEGGIAGLLQVERWNGIEGSTLASLTANWRFGAEPDDCFLVDATEYAPNNLDAGDHYGIRIRGTITAPANGTYVFHLTGDDAAQVWLSDTESPYDRKLLLDLETWTEFQDLESLRSPAAAVELASNQTCYVEILLKENVYPEHVSLWWTRPGQSASEIIGSAYLHSYVQPADDLDADGLPDAWEEAVGFGSPNRPNGGGMRDADGDAYSDFIEYSLDLNPLVADEDADGLSGGDEATITLTDPLSADTDQNGIPDLTTVYSLMGAEYIEYREPHAGALWSTDGTNAILQEVNLDPWISYTVNITNAGIYRLAVDATCLYTYNSDQGILAREVRLGYEIDGVEIDELWMNHAADLPAYTCYTPWLSEGEHTVKLIARCTWWTTGPFQIHALELGAVDGADADGNGIQDWMEAILAKNRDTDGDGITDLDELNLYGTDVIGADSDNDGLSDGEELAAGTDPLDADSDNDGVVDGVEVNETMTNPLAGEFDGTITVVDSLAGASTNSTVGNWEIQGSELLSKGVRGSAEYTLNFPTNDLVRLVVNAAHSWSKSSCSPAMPIDTSAFMVYVDGIYVGKYPLVSADGVYANVRAFLPVMEPGQHTVKLYWENVYSRLAVKIQSLELQSLGGPDNNHDGVKDWIEASIAAMAGVDAIDVENEVNHVRRRGCRQRARRNATLSSLISPFCIEGDARYPELAALEIQSATGQQSSEILKSAGPRWYANLPLAEHGLSRATASFQNGALKVPFKVEWVPCNLLEYEGQTLTVRAEDSLRFIISPETTRNARKSGHWNHRGRFTLTLDGEEMVSPNNQPVAIRFPEAGTYTISGQYKHGHNTIAASVSVHVIDGSFPEENPACLVGRERQWTFESMPSNIVYEVDDTIELSVLPSEAVTNQSSIVTKLALKANDTNGDHTMLARLYPNGPILDSARLDTFWIQNAVDGYFWTVETYEDSELWEVQSVAKNIPDSVEVQIKVIVGGITLDDYTLERWLTNTAYNEIGEYNFRLFHPNDEESSVCHTFKLYQDEELVGSAYGGGQDDIEEE